MKKEIRFLKVKKIKIKKKTNTLSINNDIIYKIDIRKPLSKRIDYLREILKDKEDNYMKLKKYYLRIEMMY